MGGIGYALGQIATGVGEGLAAQAEMNHQDAMADLQNRRAIALENLRASNTSTQAVATADLQDRNAARSDARKFAYGTQTAEQKQGFEQSNIILKGKIDLQNDKTIEGLKHQYNLSEQAADDARQLDHDLKLAGITVDHWEVTTDGRMVAFNKMGTAIQQSAVPGTFVPHTNSDSSDPLAGDLGGGGTPQPAAKSAPTGNKPSGPVLAQLKALPPPPGGKVGATASGPNGMKAVWTGQQWVLQDVNGGQ